MDREAKQRHIQAIGELLFTCGGNHRTTDVLRAVDDLYTAENNMYAAVLKYCDGKIDDDRLDQHKHHNMELIRKHFPNGIKGLMINYDPRGHTFKIKGELFNQGEVFYGIRLQQDMGGDMILSPDNEAFNY